VQTVGVRRAHPEEGRYRRAHDGRIALDRNAQNQAIEIAQFSLIGFVLQKIAEAVGSGPPGCASLNVSSPPRYTIFAQD